MHSINLPTQGNPAPMTRQLLKQELPSGQGFPNYPAQKNHQGHFFKKIQILDLFLDNLI